MQQHNGQQKNGYSESSLTNPLFGDWSKVIGQFPSPQSSMKQLIASHQRNCEAASKMAALVTESMSTVFHHQLDAAGTLAKDSFSVLNQIVETGTPKEKVVLHAEWAKDRLEKGISSLRDLSNIVTAANLEAGNVLAKRLNESFGEFGSTP
jgi:phasin family protein